MGKFNLKQKSISEILSEDITDELKVAYAFNYENNEKPKAINFQLTNINEPGKILLAGSLYTETGQFDLKTAKEIENIGQIIDKIKASINEINNLYSQIDVS
ncbi:hypothetical protein SAMN05443634_105148 [Chishuiella changwenlii]|uniref:Uncharacterized protein n=1 Tax=Chishuiella changwenlii TaxID=1434701 RepID=A0A1M6X855_9FLAO|nr:hypothetical protein [Chishuiella changwenlii]GGF11316.1 hypothetical protein GCM10010984_30460 [Chishuiella changwenlii]SHL02049.1 hypothetical protein SAMN05443634_105148 [Chishuiella changwenlii]